MNRNKGASVRRCLFVCSITVFATYGSLASPSKGAQNNPAEVEMKNGIKIVHNPKTPAGKNFKDLHWVEDLVIGGESENEDYIFVSPIEIIADALGNIYVLDYKDCTAKKYDQKGKFVARFGRKGQGPGEFEYPASMSIDEENRVYIGDSSGKIGIFDSRGSLVKTIKINRLNDLKILPGEGLVTEYDEMIGDNDRIKRIRRLGIEKSGQPRVVLYDRMQLPFAAIQNKDFRLEIPLFIKWDVSSEGRLYVGTANRYEIQAMTLDGKVLFEFNKDYDALPIPPAILSAALKQLTESKLPSMRVEARDFEEHLSSYPIFKSITADENGRIWVGLYQDESRNRSNPFVLFDVFSPEGVFLLSSKIQGDFLGPPFFKNGHRYILRREASGFIQAVRFRLPQEL